ncbi:MAG TPA: serine kinase [Cyanobacteria bacterium UBA8803]|nr:serine kinase [Cyanobacteria bacterium UBA9273]HBL58660.1 serine kinase [Cyanobacteria bacterium UBA8803]
MQTEQKDPLVFFNTIYEAYEKAEALAGGAIERFYDIAGFKIRLRFAGEALIPYVTPPLTHLAIAPVSDPALTVCISDSASTHTVMPSPPCPTNHILKRGELHGFINDRIYTSFQWGAYTLSILDKERNVGIYWVESTEHIPFWETSSCLRSIFHIWMSKQGIQLVHAGAVGLPSGGALLVGKGGSGKSTTALSCLNSDLFYASDDYSLVTAEPKPTVFSIYSTGKKNADDLERLPFLAKAISNRDRLETEKAVYFLNDYFPEKIISNFPLKALLIPRITGKPNTTLTPTSAAAGLAALVPSTIMQLSGAGKEACQRMMNVVNKIECYYLELGTNMEEIPQVILNILTKEE